MKRIELMKSLEGMTVSDLRAKARSVAEEIMKLRFRKTTGQLEQAHRIGALKKDLARVQTVLLQKAAPSRASAAKSGAIK